MGERDSPIPSVLKSPKTKTTSKPLSRRVSFNDKDPETFFEPKRQVPTSVAAPAGSNEDSGPSTGVNYGPGPFHTNPIGGQSVYLPNPIAHFPSFPTFNTTAAYQPYLPYTPFHNNITAAPVIAMGDYQNTSPPNIGLNFQPPVPDTTYGPMQHTYVPRFDNGAFIVNPTSPGGNCVCYPSLPTMSLYPTQHVFVGNHSPIGAYYVTSPAVYYASCLTAVIFSPKTYTSQIQLGQAATRSHPERVQCGIKSSPCLITLTVSIE